MGEINMSKIVCAIAALSFLAITIAPAKAGACPPPLNWQCHQGYGGKVICNCG